MDITEHRCKECGSADFLEVQESEYTTWRQFLAWLGFVFIVLILIGGFVLMIWANNVINQGMIGI